MLGLALQVRCNVEGKLNRTCEEREKTNKMQQSDVYYQHCLNMFRASLCLSSGEQDVCYCMWCAALFLLESNSNHIQQNQRSTPHAVTHGLCSPEDGHNDARNMLRQC